MKECSGRASMICLAQPPLSEGFTLIELVMVIILIGTLSLLGIGLFARESSFSPLLATQQLESAVLLAQQAGLAGNSDRSSFDVSFAGPNLSFKVGGDEVGTIKHSGSFAISDPGVLPVSFDALGRPGLTSTLSFEFIGDSTFRVCLSPEGAVYREGC